MRLLIATVGNRDPEYGGAPTGPLTLARERLPQRICLLPSADTIPQAGAIKLAILESSKESEVQIIKLNVKDPTSLPELMRGLPAQVRDIWEKAADDAKALGQELEIDCCPSSGTPQMQAALLLLIASVPAPVPVNTFQVIEPRYAVDGQRIIPVNPAVLRQREEINLALEYYRHGAFAACAQELERLQLRADDFGPSTMPAVEFLARFARALEQLDNAAYLEVESRLRAIKNAVPNDGWLEVTLGEALGSSSGVARKLVDRHRSEAQCARLVDLYYRSERRIRQGAYADAVNAIWILRELTLSFRLQQEYGVSSQNPEQSRNKGNLEKLRRELSIQEEPLDFIDASKMRKALLHVFADTTLQKLDQTLFTWNSGGEQEQATGGEIDKRLNQSRNDHEHRGKQIERAVAQAGLTYAHALILGLLPESDRLLHTYPFRPEALEAVGHLLQTRL